MRTIGVLTIMIAIAIAMSGCGPKAPEEQAPVTPAPADPSEGVQPVDVQEPTPPTVAPAPQPEALRTPEMVDEPEVRLLDEEGLGKLYSVGGWRVCIMEGTHAEMGYQHGRLLGPVIWSNVTEGYMKRSLMDAGYTVDYINEQSARMEKHFPPEYIEEMKGVVEGVKAAGFEDITYELVRGCSTAAELQHHAPGAPPGCTNYAVFGQWTTDGRLLHGRNLDWKVSDGAQDAAVIQIWRPTGGIPFMMVGWAGCIGSVSGMNAEGITIGEMTNSTTEETFDGIPLLIIMRRVLEETSTLEEAVAIMETGPRTLGWNFIIGDGKVPDARALEVDAVSCNVFVPSDPAENESLMHRSMPDCVRRTNHPCGESQMKKVAKLYGESQGMDLSDWDAVKPLVLNLLKDQNTWHRYVWLGEQIEARPGAIDMPEAIQLLANGPVCNDATLHSWVFDPSHSVAYVANAGVDPVVTASSMPYVRIDLKGWFK
ncbi:MAG: hypothetical protein GY851_25100 [bacterium]|nr:hypothetical protein [bacterium]